MAKKKIKLKHITGLLKFMLALIPASIAKLFIHDVWLVEEEPTEAHDNGLWLYKYIRKNHPEQKCYYVLTKKSFDYKNVEGLGKIIEPDTLSHWFWYIVAKKNITTQLCGRPCPAFVNLMEKKRIFKGKTYFLQHGITYNDMKWLYYDHAKFRLFVTTAKPEFEFVKDKFGFPDGVVQQLGLPRYDGLHEDVTDKNMILVMPTWRNYIKSDVRSIIDTAKGVEDENFLDSDYYKKWNSFLNSNKLDEFLKKHNKTLIFYPHRMMQLFISNFETKSKNIIFAKQEDYDVQDLLKRCSMVITDYSSIMFDVLYQHKPVICYQFDDEKFRKGQYDKGYLDFSNTKLVYQTETEKGLFEILDKLAENNFEITKETEREIQNFFPLNDNKNCERVYNAIKEK